MTVEMGGTAWPTRRGSTTTAATPGRVSGTDYRARSESVVVHRDSVQPVPVDFTIDGERVTDGVEIAAVAPGRDARYRPAKVDSGRTFFVTGGLEPGRYALQVRYGGVVVTAGRLYVT